MPWKSWCAWVGWTLVLGGSINAYAQAPRWNAVVLGKVSPNQGPDRNAIVDVAFSPDGGMVVTSKEKREIRVWAADGQGVPGILEGNGRIARDVAFSPDGRSVAAALTDGRALVWSLENNASPVALLGHLDELNQVVFSPDGRRLATASEDGSARIFYADGEGRILLLKDHRRSPGPSANRREVDVRSVAFSPDGQRVLTASNDGTARVWSLDDPSKPLVLQPSSAPMGTVFAAVFSPDGTSVATGSSDGKARVWPLDGGAPVMLDGHDKAVRSVAFSPDGQRLVTGSSDGKAKIWKLDTPTQPERVLVGFGQPVSVVTFSPDGRDILTAAGVNATVWPLDVNEKPAILGGHTGLVLRASFSRDGRSIVTGSLDGTARVWTRETMP